MYYYLDPLLGDQLDYVHIESTLPSCVVIISEPTTPYDDAKARLTITHLVEKLRNLDIKLLWNSNIMREHVSKKGLHLNARGTGRLTLNIIAYIRHI